MNDFVIWASGDPVASVESAWKAWQHQQREIDRLRAEVMALREQAEHAEQRAYEAESRLPRLRLVG